MSDFKKLEVWQKAHALALKCYRVAARIRRTQDLALRSQIIRAAMSIPANIVEGRRYDSDRQFARFVRIALNSAYELEYHLMVARDIHAIPERDAEELLRDMIEVRRMLYGLLRTLAPSRTSRPSQTASMKAPSE